MLNLDDGSDESERASSIPPRALEVIQAMVNGGLRHPFIIAICERHWRQEKHPDRLDRCEALEALLHMTERYYLREYPGNWIED